MQKILDKKFLTFCLVSFIYFLICLSLKDVVHLLLFGSIDFSNPIFTLTDVRNTGAAFSLLAGMPVVVVIITLAVLFIILRYIVKNIKTFSPTEFNAFCFLIAGIVSNLTERLLDGFVTDYIKLNFIDFPIFNMADIFITMGAILLTASVLRNRGHRYE